MILIRSNAVQNVLLAGVLVTALFGSGSVFAGNGNANGHANGGNGNSQSASNAGGNGNSGNNGNGGNASAFGALNAAHASAQAFAHASSNSRLGKIKAYYLANQNYQNLLNLAGQAPALETALYNLAPQAVVDAFVALQANPADQTLKDAYAAALLTASLDPVVTTPALTTAYNAWQAAVTAQSNLPAAQTTMTNDLAAAGNKPLDTATKLAFDTWLASMASKFGP